jgi:hypothetical protein
MADESRPSGRSEPDDDPLVAVFKTDDPGLLPLATMALDAEGLEYVVRSAGKADTMQWTMSQRPTIRPVVMEVVVAPAAATPALEILSGLEDLSEMPAAGPGAPMAGEEPPSVHLEDAASGIALGTISEAQLQEFTSHFEEDPPGQYFVTPAAIDLFEEKKADPDLVRLLTDAVGSSDGRAIRWRV